MRKLRILALLLFVSILAVASVSAAISIREYHSLNHGEATYDGVDIDETGRFPYGQISFAEWTNDDVVTRFSARGYVAVQGIVGIGVDEAKVRFSVRLGDVKEDGVTYINGEVSTIEFENSRVIHWEQGSRYTIDNDDDSVIVTLNTDGTVNFAGDNFEVIGMDKRYSNVMG